MYQQLIVINRRRARGAHAQRDRRAILARLGWGRCAKEHDYISKGNIAKAAEQAGEGESEVVRAWRRRRPNTQVT